MPVNTRGAIIRSAPGKFEVVDLELAWAGVVGDQVDDLELSGRGADDRAAGVYGHGDLLVALGVEGRRACVGRACLTGTLWPTSHRRKRVQRSRSPARLMMSGMQRSGRPAGVRPSVRLAWWRAVRWSWSAPGPWA